MGYKFQVRCAEWCINKFVEIWKEISIDELKEDFIDETTLEDPDWMDFRNYIRECLDLGTLRLV